jgi:ethanolamine utilization protein EutA
MEHERWGAPLGFPEERIRATVIGASQYTVQVSGNTIFISDPSSLPMRNLPVVKLPLADTSPTREVVASTIYQALRLIDIVEGRDKVALAIHWSQEPDYARLYELSAGIKLGLPNTIASHLPVVLVFDDDVGKLVGHLLDDLGVRNVVSIDAIDVRQLSYIDIGQELKETKAVPVTVKSLVFR